MESSIHTTNRTTILIKKVKNMCGEYNRRERSSLAVRWNGEGELGGSGWGDRTIKMNVNRITQSVTSKKERPDSSRSD